MLTAEIAPPAQVSFPLREPLPPLLQVVTAVVLVAFLVAVAVYAWVAGESLTPLVVVPVPIVVAPLVVALARKVRSKPGPLVVDAAEGVLRYPAIAGAPAVVLRLADVHMAFAGRPGLVVTAGQEVRVLQKGAFRDRRAPQDALAAILDAVAFVAPERRSAVEARGKQLRVLNEARPWSVYAVLAFIGVIFVGEAIASPTEQALLELGAAQRAAIFAHGQAWRLFTAAFMHLNVLHLFMNGTSLLAVGPVLERWLSRQAFFVILVVSALGGTLLSIGVHADIATVGLSGGIFGLLGALLASTLRYRKLPLLGPRLPVRSWLVLLVSNGILSALPGVDGLAHLGGGVTGALLCLLLAPRLVEGERRPALWRGRSVKVVAVALAACVAASAGWAAVRRVVGRPAPAAAAAAATDP